jgi:hypothetical protein
VVKDEKKKEKGIAMNLKNLQLAEFDRSNPVHRQFTENLLFSCYANDRYTAKEFPEVRAKAGLFNTGNYSQDLSKIIITDGQMAGLLVLVHAENSPAWNSDYCI